MSLRRQVRQTHHSGSWAYAIVLEIGLGYATVALTNGGAQLSNLPVTGGAIAAGDRVIIDYSAGVIPTVRPLAVLPEEELPIELATVVPEKEELPVDEEPLPGESYWTSGFHSVKAYQFGGTFTTVGRNEWTPVRFSHVDWDTDEFFDPNYPYYITVPAPGFYMCIADIGIEPCGSGAGLGYPTYYTEPYWPIDVPASVKISIQSNAYGDMGYNEDYPIPRVATAEKDLQAIGQGPLDADERIQVLIWQDIEQYISLTQVVPLRPRLTVIWMGNHGPPA